MTHSFVHECIIFSPSVIMWWPLEGARNPRPSGKAFILFSLQWRPKISESKRVFPNTSGFSIRVTIWLCLGLGLGIQF